MWLAEPDVTLGMTFTRKRFTTQKIFLHIANINDACVCKLSMHVHVCLRTQAHASMYDVLESGGMTAKQEWVIITVWFFFSVFVCAYNFRGHTLLSIVSHGLSPSYFLRQELATLARLVGHWAPGIKLCFPIAGITGRCCWTCIIIVIIILVNVASEA